MRRYLIFFLLILACAAVALQVVPNEQRSVYRELASFPDSNAAIHHLRPVVAGIMCFIPALGALAYAMAGTLARYMTRQFLIIFAICMAGLFSIWMVVDLSDNLDDLRQSNHVADLVLRLYAVRLPQISVQLLPYGLLLSLLYCLGRLSASREIVAMTQTGRGLMRLTTPFMVTGLLITLLCMGLNFHWAPHAVVAQKAIIDEAKNLDPTLAESQRYRNAPERRMWMVGKFPQDFQDGAPLRDVFVIQENEDGTLESVLTAKTASWEARTRYWTLGNARKLLIRPSPAPPEFEEDLPEKLVITTWKETPAEIVRPGLPAAQLGIPDLTDWLQDHGDGQVRQRAAHLTQWHSRWAQPFNCLIVVILATPLGVVFTRRGTSGGVALAVFLCGGMIFLSTVSLSLGDSGHLSPAWAAWLPNLVFGVLALYLFRRRLAGQPIYQTLRKFLPTEA
ncbi:MAG: YjgP/YjgQ family permease [Akkermansiaceae bacterium]|nr:YjgP/YjgQ family permease [Akkermansiaceae bacterium]